MKLIKNIISKKWFYLYLVPLTLFFIGLLITFWNIINLDAHYTVMPILHHETGALNAPEKLVIDGSVVRGEFISTESNLGAVGLYIRDKHEKAVRDDFKIFFRIKEKGAKDWLTTNSYSGGQFKELDLFPFGLGLISDSKNKTYIYELFSKGVDRNNALTITDGESIVTFHQLNRSELKKPIFFINYLAGKLQYASHNISAIFTFLVYFLPLYAYYYFLYESKIIKLPKFFSYVLLIHFVEIYIAPHVVKLVNRFMNFLYNIHVLDESRVVHRIPLVNIVLSVIIICEIFLVSGTNNLLLLIIVSMWALSMILYKFRVDSSYLFAISFLIICLIFYILHLDDLAEKTAIWAYLFLVLGAIQSVLQNGAMSGLRKNTHAVLSSKVKQKA